MQNEHQTVQWTSNADSVHKWERETNFHPNSPHNELCLFCFQFAFNVSFFLGGGEGVGRLGFRTLQPNQTK